MWEQEKIDQPEEFIGWGGSLGTASMLMVLDSRIIETFRVSSIKGGSRKFLGKTSLHGPITIAVSRSFYPRMLVALDLRLLPPRMVP